MRPAQRRISPGGCCSDGTMSYMSDMRQLYRVRALTGDDAEIIAAIDAGYSAALDAEVTANAGSASFHSRTGHSFVAELDGEPKGFVLATAIWTGGRPLVRMERLATLDAADLPAREALLAALVKSAYDAGVYDLLAELPEGDSAGAAALAVTDFRPAPVKMFERKLGSRGQAGAR